MDDVKRDAAREIIRFNTDLIKLLTLTIVASATGVSSLIIKGVEGVGIKLLVLFGSLILIIFVLLLIILIIANRKKLKCLESD